MELKSALLTITMTVEEATQLVAFIDLACRDDTTATGENAADEFRELINRQIKP